MTPIQMHPRPASSAAAHRTVAAAMDTAGPQVCDDMTIEVASSVMASARTEFLLICDNDGLCTGLITQAQLTAVCDSAAYTDRVQLRDVLDNRGPFASPVVTITETEHAVSRRRLAALPIVDEQGSAAGVLAH
ncbi:CBS domain-containing protein [Streptomyces sp. NPDC055006]